MYLFLASIIPPPPTRALVADNIYRRVAADMELQNLDRDTSQAPEKNMKEKLMEWIKEVSGMPKKLARDVIEWSVIPPYHLSENVQHPEWPGYTGVGTKLHFKLKMQAYRGVDIVEGTVPTFYPMEGDRNLTPTQLAAREKIISLYKKTRGKRGLYEERDIRQFMPLFDDFFFSGAMTRNGRPRIYFKLWDKDAPYMETAGSHFLSSLPPFGFVTDRYLRGYGPAAEIHIAGPSMEIHPNRLNCYLGTLLHEMVHVYINLFICLCITCVRDTTNTSGLVGHGRTFILLADAIDQTVKSWDVDLALLKGPAIISRHEDEMFYWDEIRGLEYRERKRFITACCHDNRPRRRYTSEEAVLSALRQEIAGADQSIDGIHDDNSNNNNGSCSGGSNDNDDNNDKKKARWSPLESHEIKTLQLKFNHPRSLVENEPGMQVYIAEAQLGGTKVTQSKLDRTGDIVQALIKTDKEKSKGKMPVRVFRWMGMSSKDNKEEKGKEAEEEE